MLAAGLADEAYAVLLTNQPKYWLPRSAGNRVDEAFGLEEGRTVGGDLSWAAHVGGTSKGRERPISLAGNYDLAWRNYSSLPDHRFGLFRWLGVSAAAGVLPSEEQVVKRIRKPAPNPRAFPKYDGLRQCLSSHFEERLEMTFTEVEVEVGLLPKSARAHRAWWANHLGNPQATWMKAGWMVESVGLMRQVVVLARNPKG